MSDNQHQEFVQVSVMAELKNIDAARGDAEDLAWDHAKLAAKSVGADLDSPEFEFLFKELRERYLVLTEYLEYLTFNALLLVRNLLNSDLVLLNMDTPATEDEVAATLGQLANRIVGSFAFMLAGQQLLWPHNGAVAELVVPFIFPSEDIITDTQEQ